MALELHDDAAPLGRLPLPKGPLAWAGAALGLFVAAWLLIRIIGFVLRAMAIIATISTVIGAVLYLLDRREGAVDWET